MSDRGLEHGTPYERKVVVASATGLHARPAKLFVEAAGRQPVPVFIGVGGDDRGRSSAGSAAGSGSGTGTRSGTGSGEPRMVPAWSMLSVLSLGVTHGTEVILRAEGDGAESAVAALAELLARDLDAEEPADV